MNQAIHRLPDPELEHLPMELRELAEGWNESMSDHDRSEALERLAITATETRNLAMLWALESLR
jgi:hypothetical protein